MKLLPKIGLDPIRFGMSEAELINVFGPYESASDGHDAKDLYFENDINVALRNGMVFMVGASRRAKGITYKDVDVFASDPLDVLRMFERDAGGALEDMGFIVFQSLGIALTGFHDGAEQEKALTISVLSEWQDGLEDARSISFLS